MRETSARLLRLLSLLQAQPDWAGPALARRLDITPRTLRRDVQRLRDLGYPVSATPGLAGGYRLAAGAVLPPLLLDDEEAVAVTVSLRSAASQPVTGIAEASLRALAKLEQVLPARLREAAATLRLATVTLPRASAGPVDHRGGIRRRRGGQLRARPDPRRRLPRRRDHGRDDGLPPRRRDGLAAQLGGLEVRGRHGAQARRLTRASSPA